LSVQITTLVDVTEKNFLNASSYTQIGFNSKSKNFPRSWQCRPGTPHRAPTHRLARRVWRHFSVARNIHNRTSGGV